MSAKKNKTNNELPKSFIINRDNYAIPKNYKNILILNDIHSPYFNKTALKLALNYGLQHNADTIILNGDIIDFYPISRFQKNPSNPDLQHEIDTTIQILTTIRKMFPKKLILYVEGNHEERLQKYLFEHTELLKLKCFTIESILNLDKLNIRYINNKRNIKAGKLTISHGHAINAGGLTPARNTLLKNMCNIAFGHLHRIDEYYFRTLDNSLLGSFSMGCLCELNPDYWANNNWIHGFGFVKIINPEGNFIFENKKIIKGKIY